MSAPGGLAAYIARHSRCRMAHMSCRIDRLVTGDVTVLSLSGRIAAHDLDILRELLDHEKGAVTLDLKHLRLVDRDAVQLLALTETKGVELKNCPPYIREWVERERAHANEGLSDKGTATRQNIDDV